MHTTWMQIDLAQRSYKLSLRERLKDTHRSAKSSPTELVHESELKLFGNEKMPLSQN